MTRFILCRGAWRGAVAALLLGLTFPAPAVFAQTFTHAALIDSDNDTATGCTVTSAVGTVSGIELRLLASVSGVPPQVDMVTTEICSGGAFAPPVAVGGGYPVALNGGVGGADAIEMAFVFGQLPPPVRLDWQVAFFSQGSLGADLMGPVTVPGIGAVAASPRLIPALSPVGLAMLALLMAVLLLWGARRHRGLFSVLLVCGSLTMFGVAWAAGFIADGNLGDWTGQSPVATDPPGDSTSGQANIDLVAGFMAREAGQVFVRMDVLDTEAQNHAPTIADQAFSLDENSANGTVVGTVAANDGDAGDTLSYAITAGNTGGTFAIDASTGVITVVDNAALDFETTTSFALTVEVTDDGIPPLTSTATVTINLNDVNEAPVIVDQSFSVIEDSANATLVGAAVATDPDQSAPNNTLTFAITAGNTGTAFAIDAAGRITVANSAAIVRGNSPFTLTVLVTDAGTPNLSDSATMTIAVIDINHAPSFTPGADPTVNEDAGAQTVAGWASAIDDGDGGAQTLTFNVTDNSNAALLSAGPVISPVTGDLSFTPALNANGSATITITLSDDGGTANGGVDVSAPVTVTIHVTPVNDAPSFLKGADQNLPEDSPAQTIPGWATAISAGPGDEASQTLAFNVTGNTNPGLFSAGPAIAADGTLSYTPMPATSGTAMISIVLTDDGGTANGGSDSSPVQTFTITVTAINHAPSFTPGGDPTVNEDAGAQTVAGWASAIDDGDGGAQTLTFNVTDNSNAALLSAGPVISPVTGDLSFTPALDANGSATITITLSDDGGTANGGVDVSAPVTVTIHVTPVNDAPSFTVGPDQSTLASAGSQTIPGWATNLSAGPPDEAGQTLSFSITGNDNAALFSVGPAVDAAGNLSYTPSGVVGVAHITLHIMDSGGTANGGIDISPDQGFMITVQRVPTARNDSLAGAVPATINANLTADNGSGADDLGVPVGTITSIGGGSLGGSVTTHSTPASLPLAGGTLTVSSAGVLALTGTTNIGTFTFDYRITNAAGTSDARVSIVLTASANDDTYNVTPHLLLQIDTAIQGGRVTANDILDTATITGFGPAGNCAAQVPNGTTYITTTGGGRVVLAANGSFSYAPPAGLVGNGTAPSPEDGFCYTVTGGDTADVAFEFALTELVWFADAAYTGGNGASNGTQARPHSALSAIAALDSAGDIIHVRTGTYAGTQITLEANEALIGSGASGTLETWTGITPVAGSAFPALSTAAPVLTCSNVNCLTLGMNNRLRGFTVGDSGTAGTDLAGTGFGTVTIDEVILNGNGRALNLDNGIVAGGGFLSVGTSASSAEGVRLNALGGIVALGTGSIDGASGTAFHVGGSTADITYAGSITQTSAARLVDIAGAGTANVTLSGSLDCSAPCGGGAGNGGVTVSDRTGGSILFSGASKVFNTGANRAIHLSNNTGASIGFVNNGLVIDTTSGAGFSATGGGTITVSGSSNRVTTTTGIAILVDNTTIGASGVTFERVTVNAATNGIVLTNTGAVGSLTVTGTGAAGTGGTIQGTTGAGVQLTATRSPAFSWLNITNSGGDGINASNLAHGLTLTGCAITNSGNGDNEYGVNLRNVGGTISITGGEITGAAEDLVLLRNDNVNATLTVAGNAQFAFPAAVGSFAGNGFLIQPNGTSAINASISGATFTNIVGPSVNWGAGTAGSSGTSALNFSNNTVNVTLAGRASGVAVSGQENTITNLVIDNNDFNGAGGNGVVSTDANDASTITGTVSNNLFSLPPGIGLFAAVDEDAYSGVHLNQNTVSNSGGDGLQTVNFGGTGTSDMDMAITANVVSGNNQNSAQAFLGGAAFVGFEDNSCVAMSDNDVSGSPGGTRCGGVPCVDFYVEEVSGVTRFEEVPDTAATVLTANYIRPINDPDTTESVTLFGVIDLTNGAACPRP